MHQRDLLKDMIGQLSPLSLNNFFRAASDTYHPKQETLNQFLKDDSPFDEAAQVGEINFSETQRVLVVAVHVTRELTTRDNKTRQYELAKRILKKARASGGLFAFYDDLGNFRFSLVTARFYGLRREFSNYRRYTFYVSPRLPNKTFVNQIGRSSFTSLEDIRQAFSLEAVSDDFYKDFKPHFDAISQHVQGIGGNLALKQDVALLFVIRIIFIGFVQKKGWLGNNSQFLQNFWKEYQTRSPEKDPFYKEWLEPLFFEALNNPPGHQVAYGHAPFSKESSEALQMAPYLNGELFKRIHSIDDQGYWIPDEQIEQFFDFLFQYNFTVEENELYDEELELNPEFLGIIFERLTNKEQGAVYTPRVEVDLMCRQALVHWLEKTTQFEREDLYHFLFREAGTGEVYDEYQKQGDFSATEIRQLVDKLTSVTMCDPAAGSGAFEVGMLQVLDGLLKNLYGRNNTPEDLKYRAPSDFERKKAIIANSLYGVEVKRWAVWINHLRLWLSLFVEMPDDYKNSMQPLLPNLSFKVRVGDSLVQRIGSKTFPVQGHAALPAPIKRQITDLKKKKLAFFYNRGVDYMLIEKEELDVFRAILDAEIDSRREQIHKLLKPKEKQASFLPDQVEQMELDLAEATRSERERLQKEIAEMEAQKASLKEKRPFIWSLEFAEIFFDHGGFDLIIGNPPYVRQEDISDPLSKMQSAAYKEALREMLLLDFPRYFAKSTAQTHTFKKNRKPSGRSDLYTYFYIRSLRLLNSQGVHVFICSNSWLDVGYGAWLQEFFLRMAPLHLVIDNHARRSFASADINTIISVTSAPNSTLKPEHTVRFVAFKQPFEDVILSDDLLKIVKAEKILREKAFRVYPITVEELLKEGSKTESDWDTGIGKYVGDKWGGKYLRAPDIYFTILEKGKGKLVKLGSVADIRRGFTTGANAFFYLEPLGPGSKPGLLRVRNGAGWEGEIEEEFLKPVIKSPRESRTIIIDSSKLKYRLFMCNKDRQALAGMKALEYIEWGEKQNYQKRPTCKSRSLWWNLGNQPSPTAIWFKAFNDVFLVPLGQKGLYSSDRFYSIYSTNSSDRENSWAITLNNIIVPLMTELNGRSNLGEGALDNMTYEASRNLVINTKLVNGEKINIRREIQNIFTECGLNPESNIPIMEQEPNPLPDRKALDDIVFDALGLTEEERKDVYRAVCQLVWQRLSKARSR